MAFFLLIHHLLEKHLLVVQLTGMPVIKLFLTGSPVWPARLSLQFILQLSDANEGSLPSQQYEYCHHAK
jgi:hypothetical protein